MCYLVHIMPKSSLEWSKLEHKLPHKLDFRVNLQIRQQNSYGATVQIYILSMWYKTDNDYRSYANVLSNFMNGTSRGEMGGGMEAHF